MCHLGVYCWHTFIRAPLRQCVPPRLLACFATRGEADMSMARTAVAALCCRRSRAHPRACALPPCPLAGCQRANGQAVADRRNSEEDRKVMRRVVIFFALCALRRA